MSGGDHHRRDSLDGRVASLETAVQNQGKILDDFVRESRSSQDSLFSAVRKLSDTVSQGRATNWQQLGVMLSMVSLAAAFLFAAFIRPMQETQDRARENQEKTLEKLHAQELELCKTQTWLKAKGVTP